MMHKIRREASLTFDEVDAWFEKRRVLEEWVERERVQSVQQLSACVAFCHTQLEQKRCEVDASKLIRLAELASKQRPVARC